MECTRRKSDAPHQTYEIHASFTDSTTASEYERLRFMLLGSKWVPVGILLWSALHVLLVVGGAALMLLPSATWAAIGLLFYCMMVPLVGALTLVYCLLGAMSSLICLLFYGASERQIIVRWKDELVDDMWLLRSEFLLVVKGHYIRDAGNECGVEVLRAGWRWVGRWCEEVVHLHDTVVLSSSWKESDLLAQGGEERY